MFGCVRIPIHISPRVPAPATVSLILIVIHLHAECDTVICKILATSFTIRDDVLLHHKHICPIVYLNVMVTIEIPVCCFPFECQESCKPLYI